MNTGFTRRQVALARVGKAAVGCGNGAKVFVDD
jgi:hypothetical protein